jgi:hypothetical protein
MIHMKDILFLDSKVKMPLTELPVRTVVVKVGAGAVLISPGSQLLDEQYRTPWPITDIVAPNNFHTAGVVKAQRHFPQAILWGCEGAPEKHSHLAWQKLFGRDVWPYEEELSAFPIHGIPSVNETVFLHKPSKSLIVTDLCFNLSECRGLGANIIFRLFGTYNRFGVSRLMASLIRDRKAFTDSLSALFQNDFDRIIMSHGIPIENDAKRKLREALHERSLTV